MPGTCTRNVGKTPGGVQSPEGPATASQAPQTDHTRLQLLCLESGPHCGTVHLKTQDTRFPRTSGKELPTPPGYPRDSVLRGFSSLSCREKRCLVKGQTSRSLPG